MKHHEKGFTLVELLVAIGIIAILATVVTISVTQVRARGRDNKRLQDLNVIKKGLETYAAQRNGYPSVGNVSGKGVEIGITNYKLLCDKMSSGGESTGEGFVAKETDCGGGAVYVKDFPLDQKPNKFGYWYVALNDEGNVCDTGPCTSYKITFKLEKGAGGFSGGVESMITAQPK